MRHHHRALSRSTRSGSLSSVATVAFVIGAVAMPAAALPTPGLRTYVSGFVYDGSVGAVGPFEELTGAAGPLTSEVEAGAVLFYPYPGSEGVLDDLETTLYAGASGYADFGTHQGALGLNFRATDGNDRGMFPTGTFSGSLPFNSTLQPHADVQSTWTDTFVITGGTGTGTANIVIDIHGHAESRYGANGTIWYGNASFDQFGTNGAGFAQYGLDILYDSLPPGLDPEYNNPIRWEQSYSQPSLPDFVTEVGGVPIETLTGSFVFEYGVPFALTSSLTLSGSNQITIDFAHTVDVVGFEFAAGGSVASGSGHVYAVIPEPSTTSLVLAGLLTLGLRSRQQRQ